MNVSRRDVLRGVSVALALPVFESLGVARGVASDSAALRRNVFVYVPNGVHMPAWTPTAEGRGFPLSPTLEPLAPFRASLSVLSGLTLDKARANGDGAGDHARANASFLTCSQAFKSEGADLRVGLSVDQWLARDLGDRTSVRSLELGVEGGAQSGQCDSGYACAYSSNLSWASAHTPVPKETDPRAVFERLFGDGDEGDDAARADRRARRKSVLDFVRDDARALESKLGAHDRRKLDQYFNAVRELERRLDAAAAGTPPAAVRPTSIPKDYGEHLRVLADMLVLAFATDSTRVATFAFANEGSNRSYAFLAAPEGHHDLSHHGGEADKHAKLARINRFHVEQLAHLLKRLSEHEEDGESLLSRTAVVYGSGIGDGNRHNHHDLPILVCGGGIAGDRHVRFRPETPLANLYVSLLQRRGIKTTWFGDSTGALAL